jgi:hypothetical protein
MGDVLWRGEVVSREWAVVLQAMAKDVSFGINEARRDIARQRYFYGCYRCQCCNNGNLAAFPSPFAPHIRSGRIDHAIDFANPDGVVRWLATHGLQPSRPVRGENWHVEVPASELRQFAKKAEAKPWDHLPLHIRRAVKAFIGSRNTVRDRIRDRDRIDSVDHPRKWEAKDELVKAAVKKRSKRRARVQRMLNRARKQSTKRVLRKVLDTK